MALGAFGMVVVLSRGNEEADQVDSFAGLGKRNPLLALITLILMLSMAGVPPFLGFWAKWSVLREVVNADFTWIAIIAVAFSVVGLFYYLRDSRMVYNEKPPD